MTSNLRPPAADLARLLAGEHHDPHSILGAHEYGKRTVIRALRPHADTVSPAQGGDLPAAPYCPCSRRRMSAAMASGLEP